MNTHFFFNQNEVAVIQTAKDLCFLSKYFQAFWEVEAFLLKYNKFEPA